MASGKPLVHSRLNYTPKPGDIKLPCNRCVGCRVQRAQDWATRCLHESQQHKDSCFLTLTYDPNYSASKLDSSTSRHVDDPEIRAELSTAREMARQRTSYTLARNRAVDNSALRPEGGWGVGLSKTDHQKFLKRLREKCGPLRYYMAGEYGKDLRNPHYHYLIFGFNFPDRTHDKTSGSGEKLYRSATLSKLWPFGHAWIGDVTYESCAYVAAYVMKKMTGDKADDHYRRTDDAGNDFWLMPEFNEMSRRPGIAKDWWLKYNQDVTNDDHVIKHNGGKMRPPRYYDKLLAMLDPAKMVELKFNREMRAKELAGDNTPARLAVKETVLIAKMALKKRNLENT